MWEALLGIALKRLPEIAEALRKGADYSDQSTRERIERILPPRAPKPAARPARGPAHGPAHEPAQKLQKG